MDGIENEGLLFIKSKTIFLFFYESPKKLVGKIRSRDQDAQCLNRHFTLLKIEFNLSWLYHIFVTALEMKFKKSSVSKRFFLHLQTRPTCHKFQ